MVGVIAKNHNPRIYLTSVFAVVVFRKIVLLYPSLCFDHKATDALLRQAGRMGLLIGNRANEKQIMKVKELIEILKGLDQEQEILTGHNDDVGFGATYFTIGEVVNTELKYRVGGYGYSDTDTYQYGKKLPSETKKVYVIW